MTAPPAGGSTCLTARGRDISLAALQRQDPCINNILDLASQVALYTFNSRTNEWEKTDVEGTLFVYTRLASPRHGFTIMNRLSMENLTEPITKDLDFQLQDPFLLYRNARMTIHGIWFYDKEDCQRIAQKMKILTQQEQALAQSQSGWLSPGKERGAGNAGEGKAVDILQMLTKARSEYDKVGKSSSEPKEIGGSSMLYGNPNLIKPIPVKPNTQDGEGGEPRSLSLATLFGSPLTQPKAVPVSALSPTATRPLATGSKPGGRPPVARSLSYDDPVMSAGSAAPKADQGPIILGSDSVVKAMRQGQMACEAIGIGGPVVVRGALMGEVEAQSGIRDAVGLRASIAGAPGAVTPNVAGVPLSPNPQHQHQQNQIVHCAAIQKLIQGQRGTGGLSGALQTLSESPENRLCENGVPLEHHHHLHHQHLQHQHLQHLHHQLNHQNHLLQYQPNHQPQQLLDPIQRLLQAQSHGPASSPSSAPPCCANPPPLQQPPLIPSLQPAQPVTLDSGAYSHSQHNQTIFFSPSKPHTETQHNSQSAGVTPHLPGVAPHELLQKLQLVQQEQSQTSHDAPRLCPGLAPRFQGAAPTQSPGLVLGTGSQPCMPFQVISPQRIPATVAPTMLLSPSVFSQSKPPTGGVLVPSQDSCSAPPSISRPPLQEELRVLTRSQLQATMLHLIQTDGSFLDSIYEAYVGRLPQDGSSSRY